MFPPQCKPWFGVMLVFALAGAFIAVVTGAVGYLLGYSHGSADNRAKWNAVFDELRDFDDGVTPRDPGA